MQFFDQEHRCKECKQVFATKTDARSPIIKDIKYCPSCGCEDITLTGLNTRT